MKKPGCLPETTGLLVVLLVNVFVLLVENHRNNDAAIVPERIQPAIELID